MDVIFEVYYTVQYESSIPLEMHTTDVFELAPTVYNKVVVEDRIYSNCILDPIIKELKRVCQQLTIGRYADKIKCRDKTKCRGGYTRDKKEYKIKNSKR